MITQHLSDEALQLIASGENISRENQQHLQECAFCHEHLEAYRLLIEAIAEQPAPSLQFDLATSVLDQLAVRPAPAPQKSGLLLPLGFLGIAIVFIYIFRTDLAILFDGIAFITISLITVSVCTLLLFFCLDMYSNYRKKIHALDLFA